MCVRNMFLACALLVGLFTFHCECQKLVIRRTNTGRVQGVKARLSQVFYGIPFADVPEKWTPPSPASLWSGTLPALEPKPMCFQMPTDNYFKFGNSNMSEDCLYLNVFAPKRARRDSNLPVMIFLHGGTYVHGSAHAPQIDGSVLAKKGNIIVVNIAYRLGAFGFLVTGSTGDDITGNYGLMGQRLGMQWVKDNIANFGGNPEKITLSGFCAGGHSTVIHLLSGNADDLFKQAIIISAPLGVPVKPLDEAISHGLTFASLSNCTLNETTVDVSCLRDLPAEVVAYISDQPPLAAFNDSPVRAFMPWVPHIDGIEVKANVFEMIASSSISKQVIIGTVADETALNTEDLFPHPIPAALYHYVIAQFYPTLTVDDINSIYPITDPLDIRENLEKISTDSVFICPTLSVAKSFSQSTNVFSYMFNQTLDIIASYYPLPSCEGKACHSFDIPYAFQSARYPPFLFNRQEKTLSDIMVAYLTGFVKYGNPNRGQVDQIEWIKYKTRGAAQESLLNFKIADGDIPTIQNYRAEACATWNSLGYF